MHSVFKKLPDLSYRSHKLQTASVGADGHGVEPFDIRPPYLDRGFMDASAKWTMTTPTTSFSSTTTKISPSTSSGSSGICNSVDLSGAMSVTGVTGIPNLVELDDAFNTLDPGQLLRESAAAATRAALMSEPPNRTRSESMGTTMERQSSHLVDDLLQQIYHQSNNNNGRNDDSDEETYDDDDSLVAAGARSLVFSPKCADPLKRKGSWELEVMRNHLRDALSRVTTSLIQQLTQRDRLLLERERHCDVITAILQAASPKRISVSVSAYNMATNQSADTNQQVLDLLVKRQKLTYLTPFGCFVKVFEDCLTTSPLNTEGLSSTTSQMRKKLEEKWDSAPASMIARCKQKSAQLKLIWAQQVEDIDRQILQKICRGDDLACWRQRNHALDPNDALAPFFWFILDEHKAVGPAWRSVDFLRQCRIRFGQLDFYQRAHYQTLADGERLKYEGTAYAVEANI